MEIKSRWYYTLIIFTVLMLFLLGGWWLYLVFNLAHKLDSLDLPAISGNLVNMVKWEGTTFIILLLVLLITLVYVYILDHKKTKALQEFFASFTHELKTPLASMKLQSQVINEIIDTSSLDQINKNKIKKYTERLINDGMKLEDQLDNHLQLSRIERNSPLNLRTIDLKHFIQQEIRRTKSLLNINLIAPEDDYLILADDYALQTIIRNLFENSIVHNKQLKKVEITLQNNENIELTYNDFGKVFSGDLRKIKTLFYKHNSPQGSGIGLYLIHKLITRMHGSFDITNNDGLIFSLKFKKG